MSTPLIFVTPLYKTLDENEQIAIQQALTILQGRTIEYCHPKSFDISDSQAFITSINHTNSVSFRAVENDHLRSIDTYNRWLLNPNFYRHYASFEFLCILQTDVYLFKDDFDHWIKEPWDYIGAPWFEDWDGGKSDRIIGAGNGGFSLRRVPQIIRLLESNERRYGLLRSILSALRHPFSRKNWARITTQNTLHYKQIPLLNEDIWFGIHAPRSADWFRVAPWQKAIQFAFDAQPGRLFEINQYQIPTGIHAWCKYEPDFVHQLIEASSATQNPD